MKRSLVAFLGAALAASAGASQLSCNSSGYCIDCATDGGGSGDGSAVDGDGGNGDASIRDGGLPDACISSGVEQCDGLDNDCNGEIDDGDLPGVGADCGMSAGLCEPGTTVCEDGEIVCGDGAVLPTFETCDGFDNDCDDSVDENNPGGGAICGTNLGECQAGFTQCVDGNVECVGEITGASEQCDGLDNDCDGDFDEGIPAGPTCGPDSDDGLCTFGTEECIGGAMQCVGAVYPTIEECDQMDHDCDGNNLNGFDLQNDAANCGACGVVCSADNAFTRCAGGDCEIATCLEDYHDNNDSYMDGCEFGPCQLNGDEVCNGEDDDCDGDTDEGLVADASLFCDTDGECGNGTTVACVGGAWVCDYPATVSTDGQGAIIPEADCDELDNDCDQNVDEAFPLKGAQCDDGELGVCRDTGVFTCNASDDGLDCDAVDDEVGVGIEVCDGLDNDCNGDVDDGDLADWVDIGGGVEMFRYEASKTDATASSQGFDSDGIPCTRDGVLPWTNLTQPEAEAACADIGARLCTESEWQRACETTGIDGTVQSGTNGLLIVEAEDFDSSAAPGDEWLVANGVPGYSGTGYLYGSDDDGSEIFPPDHITDSPRADYELTFTSTGTHYVWVRMYSDQNPWDNMIHIGFDGVEATAADNLVQETVDSWLWHQDTSDGPVATINVTSTGLHTLNLYMGRDGVRVDKILITTDPNYLPDGHGPPTSGCQWSYASDCRAYDGDTCNGEDLDTDPGTAGDQDSVLPVGSQSQCFADWGSAGDIYDLSGNIKEWTQERSAGVNPIRGGSYNNTANGITCQFDFLTASDDFFFPNVGFRCCRDVP